MSLKHYVYYLLAGILFLSCVDEAGELAEFDEDIIFTDSFSPADWEQPISRKSLKSGDKDIGLFLREDVMDPLRRQILTLSDSFFENLSQNKIDSLEELFTPSAYNSFKLRVPEMAFENDYIIRVTPPEDTGDGFYRIKCKLLFPGRSFIADFELTRVEENFRISDFDNDFFDELSDISTIRGKDNE